MFEYNISERYTYKTIKVYADGTGEAIFLDPLTPGDKLTKLQIPIITHILRKSPDYYPIILPQSYDISLLIGIPITRPRGADKL